MKKSVGITGNITYNGKQPQLMKQPMLVFPVDCMTLTIESTMRKTEICAVNFHQAQPT